MSGFELNRDYGLLGGVGILLGMVTEFSLLPALTKIFLKRKRGEEPKPVAPVETALPDGMSWPID